METDAANPPAATVNNEAVPDNPEAEAALEAAKVDDGTTIVNVRGVDKSVWARTTAAAKAQKQPLGIWLTRACRQLCELEAGERIFPPARANRTLAPAANPAPRAANLPCGLQSAGDLAQLLHGMAALATATGVAPAKADTRRAHGLVDEMVRAARGQAPRPIPKPRSKPLQLTAAPPAPAAD